MVTSRSVAVWSASPRGSSGTSAVGQEAGGLFMSPPEVPVQVVVFSPSMNWSFLSSWSGGFLASSLCASVPDKMGLQGASLEPSVGWFDKLSRLFSLRRFTLAVFVDSKIKIKINLGGYDQNKVIAPNLRIVTWLDVLEGRGESRLSSDTSGTMPDPRQLPATWPTTRSSTRRGWNYLCKYK